MAKKTKKAPVPVWAGTPDPLFADVKRVADLSKTGYEFMDSKWQNAEAETIAWQTVHACVVNHGTTGRCYSPLNLAPDSGGGYSQQ